MFIQFKPITLHNRQEVLSLTIAPWQLGFIESISDCLEEAQTYPCWRPVGIYIDHVLVGFAMYCLWVEDNLSERVWLDRFLIDQRYQGKGYGKAILPLLIDKIKAEYKCHTIYLSVIPENTHAIHLYENLGFRFNGELDIHEEKVMALHINP